MASYNNYQLPQHTIDYIKRKNAAIAIANFIKEHGEAPANTEQYYAATSEELERWRKYSYANKLMSGNIHENNQQEEQGELVTCSFGISAVDDNILGGNGEILRAGNDNDNYQHNYWRIIVKKHLRDNQFNLGTGIGDGFYAIGDFTTLTNISIVLDTRYLYSFFIYLKKSNFVYYFTPTGSIKTNYNYYINDDSPYPYTGNVPDNIFKYNDYGDTRSVCTGIYDAYLWSYDINKNYDENGWTDLENGPQEYNSEYIGIISYYDPLLEQLITGTVYTLNPQLKCTFNNFTKNSGTLDINTEYGYSTEFANISFWYEGNNIVTNGAGEIINQTDNSFEYIFPKQELINSYSIEEILETYRSGNNLNLSSIDLSLNTTCIKSYRSSFRVTVSKEGYLSNTSNYINCRVLRNSISTVSVTVPNLGTTTESGIDIEVVDD